MVLAILLLVVATAVLSGIVGMAGGMILMAVLALWLPITTAMMLHGATQLLSNGSRAWFLRDAIRWRTLPPYALGAALCGAAFAWLAFVPDPALVMLLVGLLPWLARRVPHLRGLDIERPATAVTCGVVVTAAQLLAGASGPLLDVFYLRSTLNRQQIVASKALTQTLGHLIKLGYYGTLAAIAARPLEVDGWLFVAAPLAAVVGTRIGTRLLGRIDEATFRRVSERVILALATACIADGAWRLLAGGT